MVEKFEKLFIMSFNVNKIKALLKEKNITVKEFASLLGKTQRTVENYLGGQSKIDVYTLEKIAEILGVPVSYFFGDSGGGHTIIAENGIAGINHGELYIEVNEQKKEIERLKAELEGCQKQIHLLEERIKDKEELIRLLREMCK